jgi:hypothetical protein
MANKKSIYIYCLLIIILLTISACEQVSTPPVVTQPGTYSPTAEIADPVEMYPATGTDIATMYPAWDRPKVNIGDLIAPKDAHQPAEGKASISGLLYAFDISVPLAEIEFIFMPAVIVQGTPIVPPIIISGDPANGDIIGKTDSNGVFYLDDVEPGLYYLLINYPDHTEIAVESENTTQNRLFEFESNQVYPLGIIKILG